MKYFLTGVTGFIGFRLALRLLELGHEVSGLVRRPELAGNLQERGVKLIPGDITDPESMRNGMEGVDGIFHLAAWYRLGARDVTPAYRTNVEGTRNVLSLMQELSIPKGVYTSSLAVFSDTRGLLVNEEYFFNGPHLSDYDRTKWLSHYEIALPMMKKGLPLVIVQPGAVYGPGDNSALGNCLKQYVQGKLRMVPKGMAVCWAYIDDIVEAHILAMERGRAGESYIIAGPCHSLETVLAYGKKITGIDPPRWRLSPALMLNIAGIMKYIEKVIPIPLLLRSEVLRITAGVSYMGNSAKAEKELGCCFRSLEEGLILTFMALLNE
ncbi:MAG: NAD-dependent epimerase/dehydratase family protein [Candidatus Cloacimonetes bacterium]|nr:NAD-dependent epimerase/dehydratase family protein [Candidatus Cloacimonadota bacterium]